MLPPGQRWQSLSHRACVQHDPCAPQAEWSDRHLMASGKVPLSSLSQWRRDHQGHKDQCHVSVGEKGCKRVLPYRERKHFATYFHLQGKCKKGERRGRVLNQESLGRLHHIPFTSQRSFFGWSRSWSFLSLSQWDVAGFIGEGYGWLGAVGEEALQLGLSSPGHTGGSESSALRHVGGGSLSNSIPKTGWVRAACRDDQAVRRCPGMALSSRHGHFLKHS